MLRCVEDLIVGTLLEWMEAYLPFCLIFHASQGMVSSLQNYLERLSKQYFSSVCSSLLSLLQPPLKLNPRLWQITHEKSSTKNLFSKTDFEKRLQFSLSDYSWISHFITFFLSFCLVNAIQSVYIACKVILYVIPRPWFSFWPSMLSNILIKLPILPLACTSWWTRALCLFQFITCPLF